MPNHDPNVGANQSQLPIREERSVPQTGLRYYESLGPELAEALADTILSAAVNVQPGQPVLIDGETGNAELADAVARRAVERFGSEISFDLACPLQEANYLKGLSDPSEVKLPESIKQLWDSMVDREAAFVRLAGPTDLSIREGIPAEIANAYTQLRYDAMDRYYKEVVDPAVKGQWALVAAPTPGWSQSIFPELSRTEATEAGKELFSKLYRLDAPDPVTAWKEHTLGLQQRTKLLNDLGIKELHFEGPGTDLRVGLQETARFHSILTENEAGVKYLCNMPSEEVYTSPDWRTVSGSVQVTRPMIINGEKVTGIVFHFKDGEVVDFDATENRDALKAFLETDEGSRRIGEVALVGVDSPIYQSGRLFSEVLLDENACCHIALGESFIYCLEGASELGKDEQKALGLNISKNHLDFMISNAKTRVTATTKGGEAVLISDGEWVV